jgi:hypothetical protein
MPPDSFTGAVALKLGRENQDFAGMAGGAGGGGAEKDEKAGAGEFRTNVGSWGAIGPSLKIWMVSLTGVGRTLKLTFVSSKFTNSTPLSELIPIEEDKPEEPEELEEGAPETFRWFPRRFRSKSSRFVISIAPRSLELSPPS